MPPRCLPPRWVTPHWVPDPPAGQSRYKRKRDGWYPFLSPHVTRFNRKKMRLMINLRRSDYKEHVVQGPLPEHCEGFSTELAESIKASYEEWSYHGAPEFKCYHCGAAFWWGERVKDKSSFHQRRVLFTKCCKGGKVYIPPFRKPLDFLGDLLHYDGESTNLHGEVFSMKEELVTQQCNIKKEVSDAQSSTPPPSDHCIRTRAAGMKRKCNSLYEVCPHGVVSFVFGLRTSGSLISPSPSNYKFPPSKDDNIYYRSCVLRPQPVLLSLKLLL